VIFDWNPEKEKLLSDERGLSFQHIIHHIERGDLLDIREHPNQNKYPNQKILIVRMDSYIYIVPYVQDGQTLFLKTIIPSRKETKRYSNEDTES
jgi:uncharacterized DUF497 family protein